MIGVVSALCIFEIWLLDVQLRTFQQSSSKCYAPKRNNDTLEWLRNDGSMIGASGGADDEQLILKILQA